MKNIKNINQIVATGSVDGILTTAALLRLIGQGGHPANIKLFDETVIASVGVEFAQAFTVDKIDPSTWTPNSQVAFVDLAVNNRDKSMTADFVRRIKEAGHEIVAVCDEHCREDWLEVLGSFDGLIIEPQSQAEGKFRSAGAVLQEYANWMYFDHGYDPYYREPHFAALVDAADAADRMDFTTHFGAIVNQAVKSRIADDSRRVYLARHLASQFDPDSMIQGWIKEYEVILQNHEGILAEKQDLGDGLVRVNTVGKTVDMTTLMGQLYKSGARVVVCEAELYNKSLGQKARQIAYGTASADRSLDLLTCLQQAGIPASGFAQKANVEPESEEVATAAIRALLTS